MYARTPERDALFETISGEPVKAERGSSAHPGFTSVNAAGRNTATLTLTGDTLTGSTTAPHASAQLQP